MNVFSALSHPTIAGDGDDIGWVPTPFAVARHAMHVRGDEDDVGEDGEYLGDDGDDVGDDSTEADIGAVGKRLGRQVAHLDKRIARKRAHGKSTAKLQAHRARKAGKLAKKLAKHGVDPTNRAEVAQAMGYSHASYADPASGTFPEAIYNGKLRHPEAGAEQPISLLIDDPLGVLPAATAQLFPFAIAKTATTLAITAASVGIPFAKFRLIGIQTTMQVARGENASGFPNQDILLNAVLSDFHVNGFANVLFSPLPIDVAGVSAGAAGSAAKIFTSLRSNDLVDKTNTIKAAGTVSNGIANAVAFNTTLSIAAICRTVDDPYAGVRGSR